MSWDFQAPFDAYTLFDKLLLHATISFSIKGTNELFELEFKDPSLIQDPSGNVMKLDIIKVKANRKIVIPKFLQVGGEIVKITTFIALVAFIGINILQTVNGERFWIFVETAQMLSYITVIDCVIPDNLKEFATWALMGIIYFFVCIITRMFPVISYFLY